MSGSTITPSLSELVRDITAHHEDVEENGWDGPMPSRPVLASDPQRRSLARSVIAHEDREKLLAALSRLSSVGVGEEDVEPRAPSASLEVPDADHKLIVSVAFEHAVRSWKSEPGNRYADFDWNEVVSRTCRNYARALLQRSAATGSTNPIPPLDDGAVERGLLAVCNLKRARYGLPPMTLENLKISEGMHWTLLMEETRCALQAALESQT